MIRAAHIEGVLIIGSGTLGGRIGLAAALAGYRVHQYDVSMAILETTKKVQTKLAQGLVKKGLASADMAEAALNRLIYTTDMATATANIQLVSESVTEDLALKREIYTAFSPYFTENMLITTNTSYLLASEMADVLPFPDRFCAFHFHDVFTMTVVDIMPHLGTADWVVETLSVVGQRLRQTPVVVRHENRGYLFNQMLLALLGAAGDLRARDIASVEDIDKSWTVNTQMAVGPFAIIDQIGLDTAWHVLKDRKDAKSQRFAALLATYLEQGKKGVKSGEGFYKY